VIDLLQCPACREALEWQVIEETAGRIDTAEARCTSCRTIYPVREGIGIFLTPDLPREELWSEVDNQLGLLFQENPEVERKLMETPLYKLSPADQFYRSMLLEERGQYDLARVASQIANSGLYTPDALICQESQFHYLIDRLGHTSDPILDIASGRTDMVQAILKAVDRPVIASDFSLRILRRDRRWLEHFDLYSQVSLLAFDARRTPFKDGSIHTMTTNQGLANIRRPGPLLSELRRVVAGNFMAVSCFYPEDDVQNRAIIQRLDLADTLYLSNAEKQFLDAGWRLQIANACSARALPTPVSQIIEGAEIDSIPIAETTVEWATLIAT